MLFYDVFFKKQLIFPHGWDIMNAGRNGRIRRDDIV